MKPTKAPEKSVRDAARGGLAADRRYRPVHRRNTGETAAQRLPPCGASADLQGQGQDLRRLCATGSGQGRGGMDEGIQAVEETDSIRDPERHWGSCATMCAAGGQARPPKETSPAAGPVSAGIGGCIWLISFRLLASWLGEVRDPRRSGRAVFPMKVLLLLGVLMFLSHTGSRNHFNDNRP